MRQRYPRRTNTLAFASLNPNEAVPQILNLQEFRPFVAFCGQLPAAKLSRSANTNPRSVGKYCPYCLCKKDSYDCY